MVLLWRVVPSIGVCLHGWRQSTSAVGLPETPTRILQGTRRAYVTRTRTAWLAVVGHGGLLEWQQRAPSYRLPWYPPPVTPLGIPTWPSKVVIAIPCEKVSK